MDSDLYWPLPRLLPEDYGETVILEIVLHELAIYYSESLIILDLHERFQHWRASCSGFEGYWEKLFVDRFSPDMYLLTAYFKLGLDKRVIPFFGLILH